MIQIKYVGPIRKLVGKASETYEIHTPIELWDLIKYLIKLYGPEFGEEILAKSGDVLFYQIIINGQNIHSVGGYDTRVCEGDDILVSVPLFGG